MHLVLLSGSFVSDTRLLFLLCLISEIPPGPREFPSPNPPFLCHFSAFASILPALSPFVLPAGHLTPTMPLVSWTLTLPWVEGRDVNSLSSLARILNPLHLIKDIKISIRSAERISFLLSLARVGSVRDPVNREL